LFPANLIDPPAANLYAPRRGGNMINTWLVRCHDVLDWKLVTKGFMVQIRQ